MIIRPLTFEPEISSHARSETPTAERNTKQENEIELGKEAEVERVSCEEIPEVLVVDPANGQVRLSPEKNSGSVLDPGGNLDFRGEHRPSPTALATSFASDPIPTFQNNDTDLATAMIFANPNDPNGSGQQSGYDYTNGLFEATSTNSSSAPFGFLDNIQAQNSGWDYSFEVAPTAGGQPDGPSFIAFDEQECPSGYEYIF